MPAAADSPLSSRAVKSGLDATVIGRAVRVYRVVGSAMDTARRLAERGAPDGLVVIAERQTRGRGRFDRAWVSPPGENLTLAIVLRSHPERLPRVNMAACVAAAETVATITGAPAAIKWPNDVLLAGHKVAGMLIEARPPTPVGAPGHAVLGIGLNVNYDPTPDLAPPATATSLAAVLGRRLDRLPVLQALLRAFDAYYAHPEADDRLYARWRGLLATLGQRVRVSAAGGGPETAPIDAGIAVDATPGGDLILLRGDGTRVTVSGGEVTVV